MEDTSIEDLRKRLIIKNMDKFRKCVDREQAKRYEDNAKKLLEMGPQDRMGQER